MRQQASLHLAKVIPAESSQALLHNLHAPSDVAPKPDAQHRPGCAHVGFLHCSERRRHRRVC